jgi:hypothetical protein
VHEREIGDRGYMSMGAYGRALMELMKQKGVPADLIHLARLLDSNGEYPIPYQELHMAAYNYEHEPNLDLIRGPAKVLGLNEEEISRLEHSYVVDKESRPPPDN